MDLELLNSKMEEGMKAIGKITKELEKVIEFSLIEFNLIYLIYKMKIITK